MKVPFDLDKIEVIGQPVAAIANVMQALNTTHSFYDTAAGQFAVAASGSLLYVPGGILPDMKNSLAWVDQKGNAQAITALKAPFVAPRISPDSQRIAYPSMGMEMRLWIHDLVRGTTTALTADGRAGPVIWTPDSRRVVFGWGKSGAANIFWQLADGSAPMERLTQSDHEQIPASLSPDGQILAIVDFNPNTEHDVLLLRIRDRQVVPFIHSRFCEMQPDFSPDGHWIAYTSNESGRYEIYIQSFPGPGGKWQISSQGGREPLWARNGKELFYRSGNQYWVADVQTGSAFSAGRPRLLFEQHGYVPTYLRNYDISPDGRRFLMVEFDDVKPQPVTEIIFVQNWFEELKHFVPSGGK
jgi:Tol biopolymer transport system component